MNKDILPQLNYDSLEETVERVDKFADAIHDLEIQAEAMRENIHKLLASLKGGDTE